jgi:hypothetical protein
MIRWQQPEQWIMYPPPVFTGVWTRSQRMLDPLATDNGSCTYPLTPVPGCMDPLAAGMSVGSLTDNGCVHSILPVPGCMDPFATNYDALATTDNGSCTYPPLTPVPGCMDPSAAIMIRWQQRQWIVCVSLTPVLGVWTRLQRIMIRWQQPTMDCVRIPPPSVLGAWTVCNRIMIRWQQPTMVVYVSPPPVLGAWTPSAAIMTRWQQPTMDRVRIPSSLSLYGPVCNNYDPLATADNGSCTLSSSSGSWVYGPLATNYDPLAATDNGSCTYHSSLRFLGVWTLAAIMIRWQQPTMDHVRILLRFQVYGPSGNG